MTPEEALTHLEEHRRGLYLHDGQSDPSRLVLALDYAITLVKDRVAYFRQQAEIAKKGGHLPGSDF